MDVAKYIGLFLLKNEQCYISGLGTLQLVRKGGNYDGQSLHSAHYEVSIVPGGNVDESLANFIATNEMTSISKASETLKEYSANTKTTLQDGKEVAIPYIGSFALRDGRIIFITDPLLLYKPASIPAQRGISMQHHERPSEPQGFVLPKAAPNPKVAMPGPAAAQQPAMPQGSPQQGYAPEEEGGKLNWWRIIFVILLLIILAAGAYYAYYRYLAPQPRKTQQPLTVPQMNDMSSNNDFDNNQPQDAASITDSSTIEEETNQNNTNAVPASVQQEDKTEEQTAKPTPQPKEDVKKPDPVKTNTSPATRQPDPENMISFDAVINTYDNKQQAYKRMRELRQYGHAKVIEEDTNYYFVAIPIKTTKDRKKRVIDSLTNRYNLDGVFVY